MPTREVRLELKSNPAQIRAELKKLDETIKGFSSSWVFWGKWSNLKINTWTIKAQLESVRKDIWLIDKEIDKVSPLDLWLQKAQLTTRLKLLNKELALVRRNWWDINLQIDKQKSIDTARTQLQWVNKQIRDLANWWWFIDRLTWWFRKAWVQLIAFWAWLVWIRSLISAVVDLADTADRLESAFAWVQKTLNATDAEFKKIEQDIFNISKRTPVATEELFKIAEVGWRMWLAADEVAIFTDTVAKLSTAIDWVGAEQASEQLARILDFWGQSVANIDRLGASLVWLGNNFKANEAQILNFSERIGAIWGILWLTSSDILWVSTAFVDAGINAESGWTAVQKVLASLNSAARQWWEDLEKFARIAWLSSEQFAKAFDEDAIWTFQQFVDWLADWGKDASIFLDDVWLSSERLKTAFLAVAASWGTLNDAIALANEEFVNWVALQDEFTKRLQTNESQLLIQQNRWDAWKVAVWSSLSDVRVWLWELFLNFLPQAFAVAQFALVLLAARFTQAFQAAVLAAWTLVSWIQLAFAAVKDIFATWVQNAQIAWRNLWRAFSSAPNLIQWALNLAISGIEWFVNKWVRSINFLLWALNKIPWVSAKLWNIKIPELSLWRISIAWADAQFESFVQVQNKFRSEVWATFEAFKNWQLQQISFQEDVLKTAALNLDKQVQASKASNAETQLSALETNENINDSNNKSTDNYLKNKDKEGKAAWWSASKKKSEEEKLTKELEKEELKRQKALQKAEDEKLKIQRKRFEDTGKLTQWLTDKLKKELKKSQENINDFLEDISKIWETFKEQEAEILEWRSTDLAWRVIEIQDELKNIEEELSNDDRNWELIDDRIIERFERLSDRRRSWLADSDLFSWVEVSEILAQIQLLEEQKALQEELADATNWLDQADIDRARLIEDETDTEKIRREAAEELEEAREEAKEKIDILEDQIEAEVELVQRSADIQKNIQEQITTDFILELEKRKIALSDFQSQFGTRLWEISDAARNVSNNNTTTVTVDIWEINNQWDYEQFIERLKSDIW